jgi:alanyl-tRNA synthetase
MKELSAIDFISISNLSLLTHHFTVGLSAEDLRQIAISYRNDRKDLIIALSSLVNGKVVLVIACDKGSIELGIKAGSLVKVASEILGGGGGGKDDFATGGGSKEERIKDAFTVIETEIRRVLAK